ncbi:MAG: class II aldolase/adducin family protein [Micromonosporaceae bacterium]|nr:class II aldolase/adducin family protein [Micromonosporaceae bacterium]
MPDGLAELRAELATATRILAGHGLIGLFGHVSVLTDDPQRYLICPGAGTRKDRCRSTDIIELDLDDEFRPGLPLELYMHSEAHRLGHEVGSLIHVHSPALVTLAAMAQPPTQLLMLQASFWPQAMPVWEEPDLVRDRAAGRRLVGILGEQPLALLRWHGAVIVGRTLRQAVSRALLAEEHAKQLVAALSHGRALAPLPGTADRTALGERMDSANFHNLQWAYASSFVTVEPDPGGPG